MNVRTDKDLIEKFVSRGVANAFPSADELQKVLNSGKRLRVYQGFDPTGKFLHVGHAMGIRALRILQELGHEVIFLIGDYTAKVGDPDKDTAREMLTDETIETNMAGWKDQAGQIINFEGDNPVQFKNNYEWLSKLDFAKILDLMSNTTLQQTIERDLFAKRLQENDPIKLQEIMYPLMQGYDSVAMEVDMEIGGNDQIFNMLMGRTLVKRYLNKEKYVRANEMMDAPDGVTMSKTRGNGINLGDSSEDMYGKAMSYKDDLITKALRLLTDVDMGVIEDIQKDIDAGTNPMEHKKFMAFEVVKTIRGKAEAEKGQKHFEQVVQNREVTEDITKPSKVSGTSSLLDFLKGNIESSSSSELKRTVEQGGVEVNGEKVMDFNIEIEFRPGDVVKFGKREWFKIE